jgi:hypothetical protein
MPNSPLSDVQIRTSAAAFRAQLGIVPLGELEKLLEAVLAQTRQYKRQLEAIDLSGLLQAYQ